jgi:hypothetical protein
LTIAGPGNHEIAGGIQGHGGPLMTKVQAAYLRAIWNALGSPLCEHRKIDVERSEDGHMTGNSRCLACGYAVAR